MLVNVTITDKSIGTKKLIRDLRLTLQAGEKVALIGRNGVGKTTLFGVLAGTDKDYEGEIQFRRGTVVVATAQEHHEAGSQSVIYYVLDNLPEYAQLKRIIDHAPATMGNDMVKIAKYTEALERFGELGYYDIENDVLQTLADYQIGPELANGPLARLSGGQKRFVELTKVTHAKADLALIDEPTNHMDYVAKARFIEWLKATREAVCVISHDRDVLREVDRILDLRDGTLYSYTGNYDDYLRQNSLTTVTDMAQYEVAQRTIEKIKEQIRYARSKKATWSGTADKKNPFVVMENRLNKQLAELTANMVKPAFWIDQESVEMLSDKATAKYDKYKARNIRMTQVGSSKNYQSLLTLDNLSLGYDKPLFAGINLVVGYGNRVQLRGRNGAGKTSLVRAILREATGGGEGPQILSGSIKADRSLRLGNYEQEIDRSLLTLTLGQAVIQAYANVGRSIGDQEMRGIIAQYLFDPRSDGMLPLNVLSGGQKARFQLIAMLAGEPNVLILDEPTNHLDLPSIEELEKALMSYPGAIIYISHDSYFCDKLGGEVLQIGEK